MSKRRIGIWVAALTALPLVSSAAPEPRPPMTCERSQWMLAAYNVRFAMQLPPGPQECLESEAERSR